jgi:hypothetical protein
MRIPLILAVLALLIPLAAHGQEIYRWVDKDGVVHYADQPGSPDAKLVPYPALGTKPASEDAQPPALYQSDTPPAMPPGPTYRSLRVVSPTPNQVFFGGGVTVPVQVQLDRALRPGDQLVIIVDGKRTPANGGLTATLTGLDRGEHTLQAEVLDAAGSVVISSSSVTFYVRQPSIARPPTGPDVKLPRPAVKRPGTAG